MLSGTSSALALWPKGIYLAPLRTRGVAQRQPSLAPLRNRGVAQRQPSLAPPHSIQFSSVYLLGLYWVLFYFFDHYIQSSVDYNGGK